jgi:hypothetical protein
MACSATLKLPHGVRGRYDVSSLETTIHGAAPCPVPMKQQMIEWWGQRGADDEDVGGAQHLVEPGGRRDPVGRLPRWRRAD